MNEVIFFNMQIPILGSCVPSFHPQKKRKTYAHFTDGLSHLPRLYKEEIWNENSKTQGNLMLIRCITYLIPSIHCLVRSLKGERDR